MQYLPPPHLVLRPALTAGRSFPKLPRHIAHFMATTLFNTSLLALDSKAWRCAHCMVAILFAQWHVVCIAMLASDVVNFLEQGLSKFLVHHMLGASWQASRLLCGCDMLPMRCRIV